MASSSLSAYGTTENKLLRPINDDTEEVNEKVNLDMKEEKLLPKKEKTLAELIIDSLKNEPKKWKVGDTSNSVHHRTNSARLSAYNSSYVRMLSDPLVDFNESEMRDIFEAVQEWRENDHRDKELFQLKRAKNRFLLTKSK